MLNLSIIVKLASKIGMDKAIAYSSGSRVVGGIAGVLSIFFISAFLTGVEQGFYYTFGSILALQVFFELGLTGIMTQFAAHEASHLTLNSIAKYEGEQKYISRLASLVQFCVKWYTVLSAIVLVFLLIVGYVYFLQYGSEHEDINWQTPWILICIGTAIKLFQSPFNSIFMGLGKVKEMSKIVFWQQIIIPSTIWIGLATGLKLYVVGISYIASVLIWQIYVHKTGLERIVINLWKERITDKVSYMKEIFPFQWKISLSWISGYFIFQLFNPVLFATEGAVVAGKMGMTLQAVNAIITFSYSWMNTKIPLYSGLIAQNDFKTLDSIFNKTLQQEVLICFLLIIAFFIFLFTCDSFSLHVGNNLLFDRFLGYVPTIFLCVPALFQQYINSWATYLRCHKKEPYLIYSVCTGVASCFSVFFFGNLYGLYGILIGYCAIAVISFPWGFLIFKTKKNIWHNL